jgi:hypothetical protein
MTSHLSPKTRGATKRLHLIKKHRKYWGVLLDGNKKAVYNIWRESGFRDVLRGVLRILRWWGSFLEDPTRLQETYSGPSRACIGLLLLIYYFAP